jgi:hypothetical protein
MEGVKSQSGILRICITPASKKAKVLAQDLTEQLDALIGAIRAIEDRDGEVEVLTISMNSPLVAEFKILDRVKAPSSKGAEKGNKETLRKNLKAPSRAVAAFTSHLNGKIKNFDYLTAESLITVGKSLKRNDSTLTLTTDTETVKVDSRIIEQIESLLGRRSKGLTIQSGFVGSITVLGRRPIMKLVNPLDSSHRLKCVLRPEDAIILGGAFSRQVEVTGTGTWTEKSYDPVQVEVDSFRILEPMPDRSLESLMQKMQEEFQILSSEEKISMAEAWGSWD